MQVKASLNKILGIGNKMFNNTGGWPQTRGVGINWHGDGMQNESMKGKEISWPS